MSWSACPYLAQSVLLRDRKKVTYCLNCNNFKTPDEQQAEQGAAAGPAATAAGAAAAALSGNTTTAASSANSTSSTANTASTSTTATSAPASARAPPASTAEHWPRLDSTHRSDGLSGFNLPSQLSSVLMPGASISAAQLQHLQQSRNPAQSAASVPVSGFFTAINSTTADSRPHTPVCSLLLLLA